MELEVEQLDNLLKIMLATQACHLDLEKKMLACSELDKTMKGILLKIFESNNKITCINMDLTRKFKKRLLEEKRES